MFHSSEMVVVAASILVLWLSQVSSAQVAWLKLNLREKPIRITSHIHIYSGEPRLIRTEEFYPGNQINEARIRYNDLSPVSHKQSPSTVPKEGNVYIKGNHAMLVEVPKRDETLSRLLDDQQLALPRCQSIGLLKLSEYFHTEALYSLPNYQHIIGPAKLLFFIDDNLDNLEYTTAGTKTVTIRNIPCLIYKLKHEKAEFLVYFNMQDRADGSFGTPVSIQMNPKAQPDVTIYFNYIDVDSDISSGGEDLRDIHAQFSSIKPIPDQFMVEPRTLCALKPNEILSSAWPIKDFNDFVIDRFSFRASLQYTSGDPIEFQVGYDQALETMRVNRVNSHRTATTLTNLVLQRAFHVFDIRNQADSMMEVMNLGAEHSGKDPDSPAGLSCIKVKWLGQNGLDSGKSRPVATIGNTLIGFNRALYLGRARLRDRDVKVYEAYNSSFPLWFRFPMVYYDYNGFRVIRLRTSQTSPTVVLNSVAYMREDTNTPMMLEISAIDTTTSKIVDKLTFSFSEFSTYVSSQAPNGQPYASFYSLADHCQAEPLQENHHATVRLLLSLIDKINPSKQGSADSYKWLASHPDRQVALLASIQQSLGLSVPMIYDLESKLLNYEAFSSTENGTVAAPLKMAVEFKLAAQRDMISKPAFIGLGYKNWRYRGGLLSTTTPFQSCVFVAAHLNFDTVFAYSATNGRCYINKDKNMNLAKIFEWSEDPDMPFVLAKADKDSGLDPQYIYEIYEMTRRRDIIQDNNDKIRSMAQGNSKRQDAWFNLHMLLEDMAQTHRLTFEIKTFDVLETSHKETYDIGSSVLYDSSVISGFGLIKSDEMNREVTEDWLAQKNHWLASREEREEGGEEESGAPEIMMTPGQCQAQCVADFDCRTFSVCLKSGQLECVTSKVDFGSPLLIIQLIQLQESTKDHRFGSIHALNLDQTLNQGAQVNVMTHPNCELHRKVYMDNYFTAGQRNYRLALDDEIYPVEDRERCASMCVEKTLAELDHGTRRIYLQAISDLVDLELEVKHNDDQQLIQGLESRFREFRRHLLKICEEFHYVDASMLVKASEEDQKDFMARVKKEDPDHVHDGPIEGYCIMPDRYKRENGQPYLPKLVSVTSSSYNLKFANFFERIEGVYLTGPTHDQETGAEFRSLINNIYKNDISPARFNILKQHIDKGENIRIYYGVASTEVCAYFCLTQRQRMVWPSCQSFDIIIRQRSETDSELVMDCYMNSLSLGQVRANHREDLIGPKVEKKQKNDNSRFVRAMHFDPISSLVAREFQSFSELQMNQAEQVAVALDRLHHGDHSPVPIAVVCLCLVFMAIGVRLGFMLGTRYLSQIASRQNHVGDCVNLVEERIDFPQNFAQNQLDGL